MRTFASILIAFVITATTSAAANADTSSPTVYLALGDSLAWGYGASAPTHDGYVPRFFEYLRGASHVDTLVNLGNPSYETSATFIAGNPWTGTNQLQDALDTINDPDTDVRVVTLDIGGNDGLNLLNDPACASDPGSATCQQLIGAALYEFSQNYPVILGAIQAALAADPGDEQFFVLTYYNPWGGTGGTWEPLVDAVMLGSDLTVDCAANSDLTKVGLDDLISCMGAAAGATVVDLYSQFDDRGLYLTHIEDGDIHPTDAGYAWIARALMTAERE